MAAFDVDDVVICRWRGEERMGTIRQVMEHVTGCFYRVELLDKPQIEWVTCPEEDIAFISWDSVGHRLGQLTAE